MKVVIPSRRRADTIGKHSLVLFPAATVCIEDSEEEDYAAVVPRKQLLLHPPLRSLPAIRQWILDNTEDETVFMVDDDIKAFHLPAGLVRKNISRPGRDRQGRRQHLPVRQGRGGPPVRLLADPQSGSTTMANPASSSIGGFGSAFGVIGREIRYDPAIRFHDDMDIVLQSLLKHRIVWQSHGGRRRHPQHKPGRQRGQSLKRTRGAGAGLSSSASGVATSISRSAARLAA